MTVKVPRRPTISIKKSSWGWTAYLADVAVAHSEKKPLLEEYVRDCVTDDSDG